jgi:cytochrome c5
VIALPLLLAAALAADALSPPILVAETTTPPHKPGKAEPAKSDAGKGEHAKAPAPKGGKHAATKAAAIPPAAPPPAAPAPAAAQVPAPGASLSEEGRLLVEHKCSKCHDVGLAYSSELSDANWKLHMKRMANRPGAAITDEQVRKIHDYLKAHAGQSASR